MTPDDRITLDGPDLDEVYLTDATVHLEDLGDHQWMLIIRRGGGHIHLSLHGQVAVYETEGLDSVTTNTEVLS